VAQGVDPEFKVQIPVLQKKKSHLLPTPALGDRKVLLLSHFTDGTKEAQNNATCW
jgi:hypothetical protein